MFAAMTSLAACQLFLDVDERNSGGSPDASLLDDGSLAVVDSQVDGATAVAADAARDGPQPNYSVDAGAGCPPPMSPPIACPMPLTDGGDSPTAPRKVTTWNGRCYFLAGSSATTFNTQIEETCRAVHPDAYPASITCASEWVRALGVGIPDITWLGARRASTSSPIEWISGEPFPGVFAPPWAMSEPNNEQNCLQTASSNPNWTLRPCGSTALAFCEIGAPAK